MQLPHRFLNYSGKIALLFFMYVMLINGRAHAKTICEGIDVFANVLYWHATETVDWSLTKNTNDPDHEVVTFKTISFNWDPGFRVGLGYHDQWDTQLYYTRFCTRATDSANGTVQSAFLGSKAAGNTYQAGHVNFDINFNMLDWDLGRGFCVSRALLLRPYIGVKGGWINQSIDTNWQGAKIATENVKNNFAGGGPKAGLSSKWVLGCVDRYLFSIDCDFAGSYLWGRWTITDVFRDNTPTTAFITVGGRNFGAFVLQGLLGIGMDCHLFQDRARLSLKLSYELGDWFSQYQVIDNATGTHNNDLLLQGLTFSLRLDF